MLAVMALLARSLLGLLQEGVLLGNPVRDGPAIDSERQVISLDLSRPSSESDLEGDGKQPGDPSNDPIRDQVQSGQGPWVVESARLWKDLLFQHGLVELGDITR